MANDVDGAAEVALAIKDLLKAASAGGFSSADIERAVELAFLGLLLTDLPEDKRDADALFREIKAFRQRITEAYSR